MDVLNLELKKENEEMTEKFQKEKRRNEALETEIQLLRQQLKKREKSADRSDRSRSKSNNKKRQNKDLIETEEKSFELQTTQK